LNVPHLKEGSYCMYCSLYLGFHISSYSLGLVCWMTTGRASLRS